ncbi:unnamed protein product [Trichogramma brassicae]|uniref:Tektin n=1 Tax=Trichogramma brassicae TaxID=86971 RepID=A0A6H5I327_9HYME|nr:unnamed protein product [Trichogramma brassicae]
MHLKSCVAQSTLKDEQKAKLREFKEGCIKESGVDAAVVDGIVKGGPITRGDKIDCFSACMLKKIGIMKPDGAIDVEAARGKVKTTNADPDKANKVIDACKDLVRRGNRRSCWSRRHLRQREPRETSGESARQRLLERSRNPQLPIICRRRELPTYAPPGMCTEPVSFPSIVTGHDSGPVEVARHPPPYHYCCSQCGGGQCRCMDGHLGFGRDVERELRGGKLINAELEVRHRQLRAAAEASLEASSKLVREKTRDLMRKIGCLKSKLEQLLLESRELENSRRQLQAAEQAVMAPQLIAQNCIRLRSSGRQGADLRNDEVDELLADEVHNCEDRLTTLGKCLDQIDYELLQTKTMQYDLEQFLQRLEWPIKVDKSDAAILRVGQAADLRGKFACLVSQADEMLKRSQDWRRKARRTMESASKSILTKWCATSKALEANVEEIRRAKAKIKCSVCKDADDAELIKRGEAQLESLRVTKTNLDAELVAKCNSLFVDEHKCMTMRKTYPISILWKCLHETIL